MAIEYDQNLLEQLITCQAKREKMYQYPHIMTWLALAKNIGEAFDCYYRDDRHYIKELGDVTVNILMIFEIEKVDIEHVIGNSMKKTKKSIEDRIANDGRY